MGKVRRAPKKAYEQQGGEQSAMTDPSRLQKRCLTFVVLCWNACERLCNSGRKSTYEEGADQGIGNRSELIPIEGGERIESQTGHATRNRGEFDVPRGNPGDPVEI